MIDRSLYYSWNHMINRCFNSKDKSFSRYGGRGITVCKRWLNFKNFEKDMSKLFKKGLTLERINNNGDYSPLNCKWATRKEQANNRRTSRFITYKGITKTLQQWAEYLGIKQSTLGMRFYVYGWSIEKMFQKGRIQLS